MKKNRPHFSVNMITCLLLGCFAGGVIAETDTLETIVVATEKPKDRKDNEVTGLGKLVKTAESISREQVLNIRDLTRYDPGISVVEQGRGASSGYSIRGMDRNRVALNVDGLAQTQSYMVQAPQIQSGGYAGTGAINEIEYENVKSIEISKGSSSAEYGNGALAGAVAFRTKTADDIIREGEQWGLQTKNAYSSRNKTFTHSIAMAGKQGGFEGLLIYTDRSGHETQVHRDALKGEQRLTRWAAEPTNEGRYFILQDECPSGDYDLCKGGAKPSVAIVKQEDTVSRKDYTGENRIAPNPMKYGSQSWFFRPGYHFSDNHYLGGVLEYTKQKFDIRDMTLPVYLTPGLDDEGNETGARIYHGNRYGELQHSKQFGNGFNYGRGRFYDEHHKKTRVGVEYRYKNTQKNSWLDEARLSFDQQKIDLNSYMQLTACSSYPSVSKSCRPTLSEPYSYYRSDRHRYTEKHNLFQIEASKKLETKWGEHQISANLGLDHFRSTLQHSDYRSMWVTQKANFIQGKGTQAQPDYYQLDAPQLSDKDHCDYKGDSYNYQSCLARTIKGKNYYLALRDNMALGKYIDLGLGARYDIYRANSEDPLISNVDHRQFSWNAGVVVKPKEWLDLSYRVSTGFRVPGFGEMFGWRAGHEKAYVAKFDPEKSFNQEIGLALKGEMGSLEVSYFSNHYKGLIAFAESIKNNTGNGDYGFHNAQDAKLVGINVLAQVDWHNVWKKLPYGLYSHFAYNRIKVKDRKTNPNLGYVTNSLFDAIQPARYVVGLGYDHPSNEWGVNAIYTHSKGKSNDELIGSRALVSVTQEVKATQKRTRSWHTVDVSGYFMPTQFMTVRVGVYNLFNYRYVMWESLRQSAEGAVNQHYGIGDYTRYAAPGRNYAVTVEMKF